MKITRQGMSSLRRSACALALAAALPALAEAAQLRVSPAIAAPDADGVLRFAVRAEGVPAPGLRSYALRLDFTGPVALLDGIDSAAAPLATDKVSCDVTPSGAAPSELVQATPPLVQLDSGQGGLLLDAGGTVLVAEARIDAGSVWYTAGVAGPSDSIAAQTGDGALLEIRCFVGDSVPTGQAVTVTPALYPQLAGALLLDDPEAAPQLATLVGGRIEPRLGLLPVPDLLGLDRAAAEAALAADGFLPGRVTLVYSDAVAVGLVADQSPAAATPLAPGNSVDVFLSEGPAPVPPPAADQDGDSDVDRDDLAIIEQQLGEVAVPGDSLDLNGDGVIDETDLQLAVEQCSRAGCGDNDADGDRSPVVAAPPAVRLVASGALTAVHLGAAVVSDAAEGPLAATASRSGNFRPGRHVIHWSATDASGRSGSDTQLVEITPLVGLTVDQIVAEGSAFSLTAELNGHAVEYPVTVPFTVAGTAVNPDDHDAVAGSITIAAGTRGSASFSSVADALADDGESVHFSLGLPVNAAPGPRLAHTVTLSEGNSAPRPAIAVSQAGVASSDLLIGGGLAQLDGLPGDADPADAHGFDWSASAACLQAAGGARINPDPAACASGVHLARLRVDDDSGAVAVERPLRLLASAPTLGAGDTDGDGESDAAEGLADADADGIPAWRDRYAHPALLNARDGIADGWLVEAEPGLQLALGEVAFAADQAGAEVDAQQIADHYGVAVSGLESLGGLRDVVIKGLGESGQSVRVVLPQSAPIPDRAVMRLLNPQRLTVDFVDDGAVNVVSSAASAEGLCPPPGDADYLPGLVAGHWCVQLAASDGGANDGDGAVNGRLRLIGGVIALPAEDSAGGGGGCTLNPRAGFDPLLPLMALVSLLYLRRRRRA